ncbi:MAG: hypothetical protein GYA17_12785, partial [Chloroflexi bacterium]|nr:hypothetical protein [Chloroflexota bacterium]
MTMLSPRWIKVLRDLASNRMRTLLVVLSIAVGVFAVGSVSSVFILLQKDLNTDYQSSNPHVAVIYSDYFDEDMVYAARKIPGVSAAEGRSSYSGQVELPDGSLYPISIQEIQDIGEITVDQVRLESGSPTLDRKEIYIDRTGLEKLPVQPGDDIRIQLSDQRTRQLRVNGVVHDVAAFSTLFSGTIYAYVSPETMEWLRGTSLYDQLLITV